MTICTKLVQWLTVGGLFLVVWYSLVSGLLPVRLSNEVYEVFLPLPVYLVICFGCYSLSTVGYQLMDFNDCELASKELMEEIREARRDLSSKGMKLEHHS